MKKEILVKVEAALPITGTVYPTLDRLLPEEQFVFIVRHMLIHQLKTLMSYPRANERMRTDLVFELALNGFRLAQVVEFGVAALNREVRKWEGLNGGKVFRKRRGEGDVIDLIDRATVEGLILTESPDHGYHSARTQLALQEKVAYFLELSYELAERKKLTLSDLSAWIDQFMVKHHA